MYLTIVAVIFGVLIYKFLKKKRAAPLIDDLHKRHVLITGCDSGFGRLTAKKLDGMGMKVYAGCYLETSVRKIQEQSSSRLKAFHLDVTDKSSVQRAVDFIDNDAKDEGLWALINNAGISGIAAPFEWSTDEDFEKVFDVNFFGVVKVTRAMLPLIRKKKEGRVVVMSSMFGRLAVMAEPYTCAKHAVDALMSAMSLELGHFHISTHILNPTFYLTPLTSTKMQAEGFKQRFDSLTAEAKESYGEEFLAAKINAAKYIWEHGHTDYEPVADAYVHAVTSKYPQHRYNHMSWDSYVTVAIGYFPRWLQNLCTHVLLALVGGTLHPRSMQ